MNKTDFSSHPAIIPVQMNVTDEGSIEQAFITISDKTTHIDLLINNNPLLTLFSLIPDAWMNRMLKWKLGY